MRNINPLLFADFAFGGFKTLMLGEKDFPGINILLVGFIVVVVVGVVVVGGRAKTK